MIYEPGKIKALRLAKGWKQRELAKRSGLSQPTISGLEHGMPEVKGITLVSVCRALGVRLSEITNSKQFASAAEENNELDAAIALFESLPPNLRRAWLAAGDALLDEKGEK